MKIHFILVEPAVPENIGATCRALKTMGFDALRVVNSNAHLEEKTRWVAHGSADILDGIIRFNSLSEAIADMDFVIGSTARKRTKYDNHISSRDIANFIKDKSGLANQIAIVFGSEESGLSSSNIELCHAVTKIPIVTTHPSLNLSQAVMLYAYELSVLNLNQEVEPTEKTNAINIRSLMDKIDELASLIEINKNQKLYHNIKQRIISLSNSDMHIAHSVCAKILSKIKRSQN